MKLWLFPIVLTALFGVGAMLVAGGQPLAVPAGQSAQTPHAAALDIPWTAVRAGRETTGSIR